MTAMDEATESWRAPVDSKDPRVGVAGGGRPAAAARAAGDLQVANARAAGWSWQEIAAELGVSRQAVHKKHAARRGLLRRD
jgi:hypothetical protein